jgi:DNA modification methylase
MEKLNIAAIKPNEENPRFITDAKFKKLVKSIKDFPEMLEARPLVIDEDNVVLGGNMRLKALRSAGVFEIPVKRVEGWTAEQKKEFIIKDNLGYGEWDWELVANGWDAEQLEDWGLDIPSFEIEPEAEAVEDDYSEPDDLKVDVVLGDLIEIGQHRLLCGDSTDSDQLDKLMNGEKADIAFTSPPYNAGNNVRGNFYQNDLDNKSNEDYTKFLYDFTINTIINSKFSFVNIQLLENNKTDLIDYQYKLKNNIKDILVWNKNIAPPHINKGTFSTKWEYVFAFSENNKSRSFPCQWQGKFNNVIETENASGNQFANIHKATFPVSFPSWIIEKMDFAKSILDVFMGTGTTMVAAHQLNRKCYGMELDPKYCQVIIDRMAKLDETLNIKINGKPYKTKAD